MVKQNAIKFDFAVFYCDGNEPSRSDRGWVCDENFDVMMPVSKEAMTSTEVVPQDRPSPMRLSKHRKGASNH